ncbi:MAG: methytransferase partner Trm112 [Chloroflexota bacterium]|nr:methytransferase partner Trm112 [Chloroflexota bacterium]
MKKSLVPILACPVCKSPLKLKIGKEQDGEVVSGELLCSRCAEAYPIEGGIPNLLPPELRK